MSDLYWHVVKAARDGISCTVTLGESPEADVSARFPMFAPFPFDDDGPDAEWTLVATFDHEPSDEEVEPSEQ